jgi:mannose-6-phosphate isomerase
MDRLPILLFEPLLKELVWGGRRLGEVLERQLPGQKPIGESWEVVDLPGDQSVVRGGPLAGLSLEELGARHGPDLLGEAALLDGRFPVLVKFIDATQTLSVQVHPTAETCARLGAGARPKTEAWYIIECEPASLLYVGLAPGVDRAGFARAIEEGSVAQLLAQVRVKPGDLIFLPAGTIHAIGAGIVLAEVQQSSDTTFRVFDWNRVGLDGKPRTLHVSQALESIDFSQQGPPRASSPPSGRPGLTCDYFQIEKVELIRENPATIQSEGQGPLVLVSVHGRGEVTVRAGDESARLTLGQTALVPAGRMKEMGRVELQSTGEATVLSVQVK